MCSTISKWHLYGSTKTQHVPGKKFNGITVLSIEQFFLCEMYRNLCVQYRYGNGERINKTLLPSKFFENQIKSKIL